MSNLILSDSERHDLISTHFSRASGRPGIYLANHSLGRPLDQTLVNLTEFTDLWFNQMDDAWGPWLSKVEEYQSLVAGLLHHPRPDGIILKTSVGQALRAVLNSFPDPPNVVTTTMEFDSVDFILKTYQSKKRAQVIQVQPNGQDGSVPLIDPKDLLNQITDQTDLVVFSHSVFTTGQIIQNINEIIAKAHHHNAYVLLDTYHSFGVVPINFPDLDFAMGGSYKYIHGGPGACWLSVSPKILDSQELQTLDTGWFAKENLFGYRTTDVRAKDGHAWWESTPPVIAVYQAIAGLEFIQKVGVERLRATSLNQQAQLRQAFTDHSIPVFEPQNPVNFGAFSLLPSPHPAEFVKQLKQRGITADSRREFVRFCPDLLNTEEQFHQTAKAVREILASRS